MTPPAYVREISWGGPAATEEARKALQQAEQGFVKQSRLWNSGCWRRVAPSLRIGGRTGCLRWALLAVL